MMERRKITEDECVALLNAQGVPPDHWAFRCPKCGHIQSVASLMCHGLSYEEASARAYYACEGRFTPATGCDWTLGGLFQIHTLEVVTPGGRSLPCFEPAAPEEAQALMLFLTGKTQEETMT